MYVVLLEYDSSDVFWLRFSCELWLCHNRKQFTTFSWFFRHAMAPPYSASRAAAGRGSKFDFKRYEARCVRRASEFVCSAEVRLCVRNSPDLSNVCVLSGSDVHKGVHTLLTYAHDYTWTSEVSFDRCFVYRYDCVSFDFCSLLVLDQSASKLSITWRFRQCLPTY